MSASTPTPDPAAATPRYEHSIDLAEAQAALQLFRKHVKRLHFFVGGKGYDNMGRRELEQVRLKLDEADHWLAAASRSLNAGGERAVTGGFWPPKADA